ncbi:hypothetical protein SAMN05216315_10760 [Nitrosospira sp. Nsp18]|uniref:hypothetical protein n=1 Tax=Nitrosospira sp. Nsp18 TaxID=1855334 RepID=UPI0008893641|nr:hypothetical protein [Nitrosospira sp. Nsp18]SDA16242.1 hypothetical protein SAMN05216315_10760 [Nitrosospira sp. Nsp18]
MERLPQSGPPINPAKLLFQDNTSVPKLVPCASTPSYTLSHPSIVVLVLVNAPAGAARVDPSSPYYAGTLSMFGHHVVHGSVTFTIPLSGALAATQAGNLLWADAPVNIQVVPEHNNRVAVAS